MKKIMYVIAVAAAFLAVGCKKEKVNPEMPSIAWESNPTFGVVELTNNLEAVLTASAPANFQELKIVLGLGGFNILANPYISISSNKGSVLDLIGDTASVSFVNGLGMSVGPTLQGRTEAKLNLKAILDKILEGQVVDNNTTFTLEVRIVDQRGNTATKTAKFHFTAAPVISWTKNPSFVTVDLDAPETECKVDVWAPGKIEKLLITVGEASAPTLRNYVKNRTNDQGSATGELKIDLVGDSKVAESFKGWFPAGDAVSGKEQVTLDFGFMYNLKYDLEASTNYFVISVEDKNGKSSVQSVVFKKN